MRFDSTPLDPALVEALADKGFHTAFPIQELTLEMGIRGQDIIGQARTGTGKTLGFGLPLLHRLDPDKKHIQALVVAPTRELTAQVAEDLQIGQARGLHVTAIYGGVPIDPQFDELKRAHVVVGTPGRLLDHLNRGTMDLSRVSELVLDEADEMLDMGFLPDVERLMAACPSSDSRHTSLFSATMAPAIVSLARRYMNSPSFLHAKSDEPQTAELVDQHFFQVHRMDKPRLLARIMQQPGREGCYVFTRTKAMADRLVTELDDLGISAIAIHGDLRQSTREKNLDKFRDGKADILVATEVAARGLDVDNVTHVVNYDCPDDDKMYLHRIGRTARAGRSGVAVTFAEHNEVDRLNVIRKAVGAFDGDLPQVFSTSKELIEIFDLPEETPWDHLARTSRSGGKGSSSGRGKGSSDRSSRSRRDDGRDGGKDNGRDNGRDRNRGRSSSGRKDEGRSRDVEAKRSTSDDKPQKQDRESTRSRTRDTGDDQARTRTRTRSRTRTEDATTTSTRQRDDDRTPKGKDDSSSNGRTRARARGRQSGDAGREQGDRGNARTSDEASSNGGGRRRARRGRGQGADTTSTEAGNSASDRQSRRGSGSGRSSGGSGGSGSRSSSNRSSGNQSGGNQSGGNQSGGRGGQSRSRSSRTSSKRQTTSSGRAPTRTTAERPVARGKDARGEGDPRLARRIEVENLP